MAQCELINKTSFKMPLSNSLTVHFDSFLPEDFFSYEYAIYFYKKGPTFNAPTGLINVGYNCYMNAVIQCLAFTPGFANFCLSIPNAMYQANKEGAFFLDSFAHLFSLMDKNKSICSDWLITDSHYIREIYQPPFQQDAHEFLLNILDKFNQECKKALNCNDLNSCPTFISRMFFGKISTSMMCKKCKNSNRYTSTFSDISIPIRKYESVEEALNEMYTSIPYKADGKCENCSKGNCLFVSKEIVQFPPILILTLMRFDNQCKKIDDFLEYQKYITIGENKAKYQLYAMIIHEGRMINHGHFISYVMNAQGIWYKTNDTCVFKIKEEKVFEQIPYVLFYKICGI